MCPIREMEKKKTASGGAGFFVFPERGIAARDGVINHFRAMSYKGTFFFFFFFFLPSSTVIDQYHTRKLCGGKRMLV